MKYFAYTEQRDEIYPVCFLVPRIDHVAQEAAYLTPFSQVNKDFVLMIDLHYEPGKKKTSVGEMKRYVTEELMDMLDQVKAEYLLVTDAEYFKVLTKSQKADANVGYVMDCAFGPQKVIYLPSHKLLFHDPIKTRQKISLGMNALIAHKEGRYTPPGDAVIHSSAYPVTPSQIKMWLDKLLEMDCDLTCDIEAFGLKHYLSGIGTISFAWDKHNGIAFPVDYQAIPDATEAPWGEQRHNAEVRAMLLDFFMKFKRKMIYHNIAYDGYVLVYQLFMVDIIDTEGLLEGLEVILRDWDCTKLITYLATNSCSGNKLGLKDQSQEFAGNYAKEEIKDIRKIPLREILEYNLVDALATWYVREKHYQTMVTDQQLPVYQTLFQPATVDIVQMQLTGMPVDMEQVVKVKAELTIDHEAALKTIHSSPLIAQFVYQLNEDWVVWKNSVLKKKQVTLADAKEEFNPNSPPQLQKLLYDMIGLPVLAKTDSGLPSSDGDTLKKLVYHTQDPLVKELLKALLDFKLVDKILTTFVVALENAVKGPDGWHYLFGNFNLGGTVSGRLSSSDPNLQNLPANSKYAKKIKSCFKAPPGWLLVGLDFASLEDRISALTTKDPNKLKVYTDGFDGHAMRAVAYWPEEMPDIDPTSVISVNAIAEKGHKYAVFRQDSKAPTFALTYQGTFATLMVNCGFSEKKAKTVEARFKELYKVSIDWVSAKLDQASRDGYVTVAFGLRVRTHKLAQVIRGNRRTPKEAEAEGRTAGNALGQSWCLLNSRAWVEFMGKVRSSKHRLDIRPCAQIHDAGYALMREDPDALLFTNKHLVEAVEWQAHPDIEHPDVKLGGELSIFYPSWEKEITLPNKATLPEMLSIIDKALNPEPKKETA